MILNNINEYNKLVRCIMSKPIHYSINTPINKLQEKNIGNIDSTKSMNQYETLINILENNKVKIHFMGSIKDKNYQVFTRDIGFVIFDTLFICKMRKEIRNEEVQKLLNFSEKQNLKIHVMKNHIEGGDVFVHNKSVFIGISSRTDRESLDEISNYVPKNYKIIGIEFEEDKLHLDCVFNVINDNTCVYSEDYIFNHSVLSTFKTKIKIPKNVVDELGTNYFIISDDTVIVTHKEMKKVLSEFFKNTIYIDYSEFIKGGGSVRCSILPIERA